MSHLCARFSSHAEGNLTTHTLSVPIDIAAASQESVTPSEVIISAQDYRKAKIIALCKSSLDQACF